MTGFIAVSVVAMAALLRLWAVVEVLGGALIVLAAAGVGRWTVRSMMQERLSRRFVAGYLVLVGVVLVALVGVGVMAMATR